MLGANLHFGSCPEDKILNMLQATIQKLQEVLYSERTSSTEAHGMEFTKASVNPLVFEDSAQALRKVLHLFKESCVLHTHSIGSLREALSTTVRTLMERDRHANYVHMLPKRETRAKQLGKSFQIFACTLIVFMCTQWHSNLKDFPDRFFCRSPQRKQFSPKCLYQRSHSKCFGRRAQH